MNSRAFGILFLNLAILATANGIFFETGTGGTVLNGANLILATGTAGTLATPLAILGVLSLASAGALALGYISLGGDDSGDEYGRSSIFQRRANKLRQRRRQQRSAETGGMHEQEALFTVMAAMDTYGCGKQLICELEARNVATLVQDEIMLVKLFGNQKNKKTINPASPKAEFDLAAQLGLASKSEVICRERYAACPYTAPEMMASLRNAQW